MLKSIYATILILLLSTPNSAMAQDVEVFVASDCPHCEQVISYLREKGIAYRVYELEYDRIAEKDYFDFFGRGILPAVRVGTQGFRGFQPDRLDHLLAGSIPSAAPRERATAAELMDGTETTFIEQFPSATPIAHDSQGVREVLARKQKLNGLLAALMVTALAWGSLLVLGMADRIVIFYDSSDLIGTLGAVTFSFVGLALVVTGIENDQLMYKAIGGVIALGGTVFTSMSFINAARYNQSILIGIIVGWFKLSLFWAVVALLFSQRQTSTRNGASLFRMFLIGSFCTWIVHSLVNGTRVWERRQWCPRKTVGV